MIDREKQERERAKILEEVVALSKEHKHLVINLPTGTGKGLAVAQCIRASESEKEWLVLVPETSHILNYLTDLKKHGNIDLLYNKIKAVICYASLYKYENTSYSVHLNEAHRVSEARMDILKTIHFDQVISDTATLDDNIERRLNEIEPYYKYSKSLQEVIDLGILPQPEIVCIGVELTGSQNTSYKALEKSMNYWRDQWETEGGEWRRIRWLGIGNKRKKWMSDIKTEKAKEIIESFGDERFVVFAGSIDQAVELGGERAIHSKNKNSKQVIEDFNNKTINSLFSCKMNIEGFNYNYLNKGLIVQIDGGDRTTLQKLGRLLRGDNPILYIIYLKNTQDEKYLKSVIKEMNKEHINFI